MVAVQGELWASLAISTPVENFNYGTIFNRYWHDSRMEFIVLASELTTAGFQANDEIREIRQWVEVVPDSPGTVTNARVALKHTTGTTFSTGNFSNGHAYSTFTEVFYRASMDFTVPQSWASFVLDTPFVWNGTDNLIIHFSRDTSSFSDNGQTRVRTIGTNRTRLAYHDSEVTFPFDNKSASLFTVAPRTYIVAERNEGGTTIQDGSANIKGTGTLTSTGTTIKNTTANLFGTGLLSSNAVIIKHAQATLIGNGLLLADGSILGGVVIVDGSVSLIGQGTLTANGTKLHNAIAELLGTGILMANADVLHIPVTIDGEFIAVGAGFLTANGMVVKPMAPPIISELHLTGSNLITINLKGKQPFTIQLTGTNPSTIHLKGGIQ